MHMNSTEEKREGRLRHRRIERKKERKKEVKWKESRSHKEIKLEAALSDYITPGSPILLCWFRSQQNLYA